MSNRTTVGDTEIVKACRLFVRRIQGLDIVQEVRRSEDEDSITVWTIVTASLLDYEALKPVYEAELEAMRFVDEPVFDFRIVSASHLKGRSIEDFVPARAKTIWKRQDAP